MKNVLIVYAHAVTTSFNAALRNVAEKTLRAQGHNVVVSDLYAMNFNPVASCKDITGEPQNKEHFNYAIEAGQAWKEGRLVEDIVAEQEKLTAADLVIFQFPLQWMSVPAILKGWFDRVLLSQYAFSFPAGIFENGHLKGKKSVLSFTTGIPQGMYTPFSPFGDLNAFLSEIQQGTLRFVGLDILAAQVSYSPGFADQAGREGMLKSWETRLGGIWEETPIVFPSLGDFDLSVPGKPFGGMQLKKEVMEKTTHGMTPSVHLRKPIPEGFYIKTDQ